MARKGKTFSHEITLAILIGVVSFVISLFSPAFLSFATLFDLVRSSLPLSIMALGILPVLIAGEIDISFVSVAAMSSFATHMMLLKFNYQGGISLYLIIASIIGALAGLVVGIIATSFNLPVFHVSLGLWMFWYGFNLYFLSPTMNFKLPQGLVGYYSRYLVTVKDPVVGITGLHTSVIYLLIITLFIWWLLKYTLLGRALYAIGGNREVAIRTGYNVKLTLRVALIIDGVLAAIAGVVQSSYSRFFNPILFRGNELLVIAAAVIGGVSITGGYGSVIGVILGVFFIQISTRGLIYLGIPAEYQQFVLGAILIIFFAISSAITENDGGRSFLRRLFRRN
ncbi:MULTISPECIES: ABC transporter permease [Pseudothermotoga]|jgi:simple sugar transport system permease protein|uniref:Inner-membrane translocator n=1 Tax=Pseudothermotoga lettingae (strain ATCC BAA-301 / DSM 14385 / NBRC 107922 / TMO) TaxID=416591 RepID=A8F742_PSELT|nr:MULTISPECIES: ABC transporter permease [Pseudothermotoga]ABV33976.1 inner-membrane translocator [Pseudothermotoga lettingae TMO]MDK2884601.1 simple sugar transport system permease protein [Pseudothermotoga sp.]GLI49085.1 sugar ABC transporter permease [Pseudothermotoga lettingae TMO]